MKETLIFIGLAMGVTATILIGTRLSTDALGILVGVTCGISAGIPVSVLLVWALVRRTGGRESQPAPQQPYPPVIVIGGGDGRPLGLPGAPAPWESLPPSPRRDFKVVPDDDGQWEEA